MSFRFLVVLSLLLSLMWSPVYGQKLDYEISIVLSEDFAHETIGISIDNTGDIPLEELVLELPQDAYNVKVYNDRAEIENSLVYDDRTFINARLDEPLNPGFSESLIIEFDTAEYISYNGFEYIFSAFFSPPISHTESFVLKITLPKGMGLLHPLSSATQTDIAPLPDSVVSDGASTMFIWDEKVQADFAVLIRYVPFLSEADDNGKTISRYYGVLFILIVLLLVIGLILIRGNSKKSLGSDKTSFMKDDEKRIIGLVRNEEGVVQKRLVDKTGFSKAKISKIVSDLESRDIIRVEYVGRRKKLYLTDEFKNT